MTRTGANRRYQWSGYLLGFALGGFFDGIVLHQVLQWHHMLTSAGFPPDSVENLEVNTFADATHDHQWIHVDVEKAKSGPFGGTIVHGYMTLSLLPMLSWEVYTVEGVKMGSGSISLSRKPAGRSTPDTLPDA